MTSVLQPDDTFNIRGSARFFLVSDDKVVYARLFNDSVRFSLAANIVQPAQQRLSN
jgi:hypothetical protein